MGADVIYEHRVEVVYTIDDDGIHLECRTCGWDHVAGFSPSVLELAGLAAEHDTKEQDNHVPD